MSKSMKRLFPLGSIVATPGAIHALADTRETVMKYVNRHENGDWGDLVPSDGQTNDAAVRHGERILSAYKLINGHRLWIITEADRSVTTLLLPSEY